MSLPSSLISAATLGTAQSGFAVPPVAGPLGDLLAQLDRTHPEAQLLLTVAALKLHEQAGWIPPQASRALPEPGPIDETPVCGRQALRHLLVMLKGHYAEALPEWLRELARLERRIPEEALPLILDAGRKNKHLRDLILPVIGARGRWLALTVSKRDWDWFGPRNVERVWGRGSTEVRAELLTVLRQSDPGQARELLDTVWSTEKAEIRRQLLETFEIGLSIDDEPFLEAALDDRSKMVRMVAIKLLAELPAARFRARMEERVLPLLTLERAGLRRKPVLEIKPCPAYDDSMARDGIPDDNGASDLPLPIWWTMLILRGVAPSFWCAQWQISLDELIEAAQNSADAPCPLLHVLAEAAVFTGDDAALWGLVQADAELAGEFASSLTHAQREQLSIDMLRDRDGFRSGHRAEKILWAIDQRWSPELSTAFVISLGRYLNRDRVRPQPDTRSALLHFARLIALEVKDAFLKTLDVQTSAEKVWSEMLDEIRLLLDFRDEMITAVRSDQ